MTIKFQELPAEVRNSALSVIEHQLSSFVIGGKHNQQHADAIVEVVRDAYVKLYEDKQ